MYFEPNQRYTIRKCINDLRRIGRNVVELRNGVKILIPELNADPKETETFSRIKGESRVMRRIYCRIVPNEKAKMIDELSRYSLFDQKAFKQCGYSFFERDEYLVPERVLNAFISANHGIDHYITIASWEYLLSDMMDLASI